MTFTKPRQCLTELANELLPNAFDSWKAEPIEADWYAHDVDPRLKHILDAIPHLGNKEQAKFRVFAAAILARHALFSNEQLLERQLTKIAREGSQFVLSKPYTVIVTRMYLDMSGASETRAFSVLAHNPRNAEAVLDDDPEFKRWFAVCQDTFQTTHKNLVKVVVEGKVDVAV